MGKRPKGTEYWWDRNRCDKRSAEAKKRPRDSAGKWVKRGAAQPAEPPVVASTA